MLKRPPLDMTTPVDALQGAEINRGQTDMGSSSRSLLSSNTPKRRGRPKKKEIIKASNADLEMTLDTSALKTPIGARQGAEINKGQTDMGHSSRSLLVSSTLRRRGRPKKIMKASDADSEMTLDASALKTPIGARQGAEINKGQTDMEHSSRSLLGSSTLRRRGRPKKVMKASNADSAFAFHNVKESSSSQGKRQRSESKYLINPYTGILLKRVKKEDKKVKNCGDGQAAEEVILDVIAAALGPLHHKNSILTKPIRGLVISFRDWLCSKDNAEKSKVAVALSHVLLDASNRLEDIIVLLNESDLQSKESLIREAQGLLGKFNLALTSGTIASSNNNVQYSQEVSVAESPLLLAVRGEPHEMIMSPNEPCLANKESVVRNAQGHMEEFNLALTSGTIASSNNNVQYSQEVSVAESPLLLAVRGEPHEMIMSPKEPCLVNKESVVRNAQGHMEEFNLALTSGTIASSNNNVQYSQEVSVAESPLLLAVRGEPHEMIMSPNEPCLVNKESVVRNAQGHMEEFNLALTSGTIASSNNNVQYSQEVSVAVSPLLLAVRGEPHEMIMSPNEPCLANKKSVVGNTQGHMEEVMLTLSSNGTIASSNDNAQYSQEVSVAESPLLLAAREEPNEMIMSQNGPCFENKESVVGDAQGHVEEVMLALTSSGTIGKVQHSQEVTVAPSHVLLDALDKPPEMIASPNGSALVNKDSLIEGAPRVAENVNMTLMNNRTISPEDELTRKERWWRELLRDAGYKV